MKKFDLIHTVLIIIAILMGYSAAQYCFSAIFAFTFTASNSRFGHSPWESMLGYLIDAAMYTVICIVLLKNGRKFTALILRNESETDTEGTTKWDLDRHNMLFVLFIGIGLYTMIQLIPHALYNIYELFIGKIAPTDSVKPTTGKNLAVELLQITLGALLIYAAPNLTNFIEKNITPRLNSGAQPDKKDV